MGGRSGVFSQGNGHGPRRGLAARASRSSLVHLGKSGFPAGKDDEAWRQVVLFSEHTWGASDSVTNPDGEGPRAQWAYKKAFASGAERSSRELLEEASDGKSGAAGSRAAGPTIDVVNTCSWERTDLVLVPAGLSRAGDLVRDDVGAAVPSQRLRTGELAFLASAVPGLGAKRFVIGSGSGPANGSARADACELGNERLTARVDPGSGAVTSLRWAVGSGRELVESGGSPGLAHYLYVPGLDPKETRTVAGVKVRQGEPGPLVASLIVESDAPGAKGLVREYRIIDGLSRLDVAVTVDKEKVRDKEGVHIAFPFAIPGGTARVDVGWGFVRPETDQIAGACRDFFCARDSVDISNADYGLTWTSLDAPLVEIGAVTDETPAERGAPDLADRARPDHGRLFLRHEQLLAHELQGRSGRPRDAAIRPGAAQRSGRRHGEKARAGSRKPSRPGRGRSRPRPCPDSP